MQGDLALPQLPWMSGAEVNERDRKQKQSHCSGQTRSRSPIPPPDLQKHRDHSQPTKPHSHQEEGCIMKTLRLRQEVADVQRHGQRTEKISADPYRTMVGFKRNVQEHGGQ